MKRNAYAKLNFFLEILNKRTDGYHNLRSIMQKIALHDVLTFEPSTKDVLWAGTKPMTKNNLVRKALEALRQEVGVPPVKITLDKRIPIGAGLGGGSSDAAVTLESLNQLFQLGLSREKMRQLGGTIGSDVPFFSQDAAIVEGTGTDTTELDGLDLAHILLARPKGKLSTVEVYRHLRLSDFEDPAGGEAFTRLWKNGILGECFNHLEAPAFRLDPAIKQLKHDMIKTQPQACLMSGSGNVVFAIYSNQRQLLEAMNSLKGEANWLMATHTIKGKQ